ncbi:hypothetical protein AMTRI_Chr05g69840 [Amborella trichopoda]|uniref:Cytochrome P450 n=1 Tax=Amborella trichopoda TaxID=13333 RepID=U5DB53_AMBTC|nr:cytochrome P450 90D2 [Amborella trichopoda]ERN19749.1 hypothetical protein AMTR_s00064p00042840 [Amborella trichopoda]|eukprot:XP_011628542.2 cytochrome P450 90D2 [Amborella trichopoda]
MVMSTVIFAAAAAALVVAIMVREWRKRKERESGVKGSLGWPFIGETLEFIACAYSSTPESFMDKRRLLYGNVFKSHILGSKTVISTDAEVTRVVLQSDGRTLVPFYPASLTKLMGSSSILLINGPQQKRLHGLLGSFLKSAHIKAQITQDIHSYVSLSMSNWKEGHLVYIQDLTKDIAFQVLVKALISLDPGEEMEFLKEQFREFIAGLISLPINLPGTRLYRSLQAKTKMVKVVLKILGERKEHGPTSPPKDVIDVLLSEKMSVDVICDNMIDMMIPGEDSVPILITLALKYLTDSPLALQQLYLENMELKRRKAQEGQQPCWNDYISLPFMQNVLSETLRMGNIITGVMRRAVTDVEIKGHLIPKDWCVFTYFRSVHLDDEIYENAHQFNPWRWQGKDTCTNNFTPFGGGQRLCPGVDLARLEASIFLHHFVTNYRWVAEEDSVVNFPTVRMKNRMPIRVTRRPQYCIC